MASSKASKGRRQGRSGEDDLDETLTGVQLRVRVDLARRQEHVNEHVEQTGGDVADCDQSTVHL